MNTQQQVENFKSICLGAAPSSIVKAMKQLRQPVRQAILDEYNNIPMDEVAMMLSMGM